MPEIHDDFRGLMERVLAGSPEAARELTQLYGPHLLRAVRLRMNKSLRPKFDSLDFVQDIWASFFADLPRGRSWGSPAELVAFLACLARNKVVETVRQRLHGQKYNVNREQPLDEVIRDDSSAPEAQQPTPSEVAMGREEWERLLGRQPAVYRRVLLLLHEGKSPAAAAQEVGISEKTVRRVAEKVAPWIIT
jgi:RNA polymerase sigma-70 factor (ECF subfamily)